MNKSLKIILGIFLLLNIFIWTNVLSSSTNISKESEYLEISFLDIGQGDAIFIEAPNGRQMIVDGGPNTALMGELPKFLEFGDKTIDVIVITNPDADHISGFIPLLEDFEVYSVVEPGTVSETSTYKNLEEKIKEEGSPHILARAGTFIVLDKEKNIYFEILFPDRDVSSWERNDGSIVGRLVYGETSFLLMGDATILTEGIVTSSYDLSGTDILKLGHHGSKTSSGVPLLRETRPEIAIISRGKDNKYGHPHKEVIERLGIYDIPYLDTSTEGSITFLSDGESIKRR